MHQSTRATQRHTAQINLPRGGSARTAFCLSTHYLTTHLELRLGKTTGLKLARVGTYGSLGALHGRFEWAVG